MLNEKASNRISVVKKIQPGSFNLVIILGKGDFDYCSFKDSGCMLICKWCAGDCQVFSAFQEGAAGVAPASLDD